MLYMFVLRPLVIYILSLEYKFLNMSGDVSVHRQHKTTTQTQLNVLFGKKHISEN